MGAPVYTTREVVKTALDSRGGRKLDDMIDRHIRSHSREIERKMHRSFWPWQGTIHFDRPASWGLNRGAPSWLLELGPNGLIRLDSLASGGQVINPADVLLRPGVPGEPATWIELNRGTSADFLTGDTNQDTIALTGLWGWDLNETNIAGLQTTVDGDDVQFEVSDSSGIGHGSLLRIDDERVNVTRMSMADTGLVTTAALTDRANDQAVYVDSQALAPEPGEIIAVGVERMLVTDRMGLVVAVERGYDGTASAPHDAGAAVFARRRLTVERGAAGTVAVSHTAGADVRRHEMFAPIQTLCTEESIAGVMQELAGMARVVGTAEGQRETTNRGLDDARKNADRYRRRNRNLAV